MSILIGKKHYLSTRVGSGPSPRIGLGHVERERERERENMCDC